MFRRIWARLRGRGNLTVIGITWRCLIDKDLIDITLPWDKTCHDESGLGHAVLDVHKESGKTLTLKRIADERGHGYQITVILDTTPQ